MIQCLKFRSWRKTNRVIARFVVIVVSRFVYASDVSALDGVYSLKQ